MSILHPTYVRREIQPLPSTLQLVRHSIPDNRSRIAQREAMLSSCGGRQPRHTSAAINLTARIRKEQQHNQKIYLYQYHIMTATEQYRNFSTSVRTHRYCCVRSTGVTKPTRSKNSTISSSSRYFILLYLVRMWFCDVCYYQVYYTVYQGYRTWNANYAIMKLIPVNAPLPGPGRLGCYFRSSA